jgi:hypothetical protein
MDPVTVGALISQCSHVAGFVYTFINKLRSVEPTLRVLAIEVDSLSNVLGSLKARFEDTVVAEAALASQTGHEGVFWRHVGRALEDCQQALQHLEDLLTGLEKGKRGLFGRPKLMVRYELRKGDIALIKQEIASYHEILKVSLQLITVYLFIRIL